jgi:hypothetical protein
MIPARDATSIELDAVMVRSRYDAHSFAFGVEARVPQDPPNVFRCLSRLEVKPDQTVAKVTQGAFKEVLIAREESRLFQMVQERNDVVVADARIGNIHPDNAAANAPGY